MRPKHSFYLVSPPSSVLKTLAFCLALLVPPAQANAAVVAEVVNGVLVVTGDNLNNRILIRVLATSATHLEILLDDQPFTAFSRASFQGIAVDGKGGNDTILLSDENGPIIEPAILSGGPGSDQLLGGAGADFINGDDDADVIFWRAGGGNDTISGGNGNDTFSYTGYDVGEHINIGPLGVFHRVQNLHDASIVTMSALETIEVNSRGGNDTISAGAALIPLHLFGGEGDDLIIGGQVASGDVIDGGPGNDSIHGNEGNDSLFGGEGDDVFHLMVGQGGDVITGQDGEDTLRFTASPDNDTLRVIEVNQTLRIEYDLGGGVNNSSLEIVEMILLNGNDRVTASGTLRAAGLQRLNLIGGDGNDTLNGSDTDDTLEGGAGGDTIMGHGGNDILIGGLGDDSIIGGDGDDTFIWRHLDGHHSLDGGAGRDTLQFHGADIDDSISVTNDGAQIIVRGTIGGGRAHLTTFEAVDVRAGGGKDTVRLFPGLTSAAC